MSEGSPRGPRSGILLIGALVVVASAYARAPLGPFAWDDRPLILESPVTHSIRPIQLLSSAFWHARPTGQAEAAYYRPLTTATFALDWRLSGGSPALFHLTNVLLHLGVVALVFGAASRLGASPALAAVGSLAFGLAPRLTESVAWVSGRTDVLATLLALAALLLYLPERGPGSASRRSAAAFLLLLGLLAKETAIAAFAGMLAAEWSERRARGGSVGSGLARLAPPALAVGVYLALRVHALRGAPATIPFPYGSRSRLLAPFDALGTYLVMLLDPLRPRLQIGDLAEVGGFVTVLGVGVVFVLVWLLVRGWRNPPRPLAAGLAMTGLAALGLAVHVVPIRVNVIAADRFLYLPMACLVPGLAAWASRKPAGRRRRIAAIGIVLAIASFWATRARVEDWLDEIRLWTAAVDTAPSSNTVARTELANALDRAGRTDEALAHHRLVAKTSTGRVRLFAEANIAALLSTRGDHASAARVYEMLVITDPGVALHQYNLGIVRARQLDFDAAERALAGALVVLPDYPEAKNALQVVREARTTWASLPEPLPREPPAVCAARASVFDRLGARADAARYWRCVLDAPDASPAERARASSRLAASAPLSGAAASPGERTRE